MRFLPKDNLKRLILLKHSDKEIYRFLVSICHLNGMIGGILLTVLVLTFLKII